MKLMSDKQAAEWRKQRARGENQYYFKTAVLWACFFTIWMSLYDGYKESELHVSKIVILFAISLFMGLVMSIFNWSSNEKAFREYCKNNPNTKS